MDHIRILRRAFDITRAYRALWVFGILIALTASRGGNGSNSGNGAQYQVGNQDWPFRNIPGWPTVTPALVNTLITLGIALLCVIIILAIVFTILRYLSFTSLISMVDRYEGSGDKVTVREGFRLGWTGRTFYLWVVDLLLGIIGFVLFILLAMIALSPLLVWLTHNNTARVIGTVTAVGLFILLVLVFVLVSAAVSLWVQITRRAIVIEGRGVFDGMRRGWEIVRRRAGDVIIMGLILFGIGLVYALVSIPIFLLLAAAGGVLGGLPGLLVGWITSLFTHGATPWITGALVALPIFLLVLIIPFLFIGGLVETFYSTVWTLTYRELLALEAVRPETPEPPEPSAPLEAEVL